MTRTLPYRTTAVAFAAAASLCSNASAQREAGAEPPAKIALTGATVITVSGDELENATVLVEYGRIKAVGDEVELPYDAVEYDLEGKVVMPGIFHAHAPEGMDVPNEALPVTPFLHARDALDPSKLFFENSLRRGITTVHVLPGDNTVIGGMGMAVRPIGLSVRDMTVVQDASMKMSVSPRSGYDRMRQMSELRRAFFDLGIDRERLAEEKYEESLDDEPIEVGPEKARELGLEMLEDGDYEATQVDLIRTLRGDLGTWVYASRAGDVVNAKRFVEEHELLDNTVFVIGTEAHKAAPALAEAGRPVIVSPELFHRERDPFSGELVETFVPATLHEAGVEFSLLPNPSGSLAEAEPTYQAALAARNGVPRSVALRSITLNPANAMGMGEDYGSIEEGKVANLVVLSGDPLDFGSVVEHVFIDGILAYERTRDPRIQRLLDLAKRHADAEAEDQPEPEDDEDAPADEDGSDEDGSDDAQSDSDDDGEGDAE
ncbi:MAG: amidohydrolase family protein [Planctomycetota bacterium]